MTLFACFCGGLVELPLIVFALAAVAWAFPRKPKPKPKGTPKCKSKPSHKSATCCN